MQKHGDEHLLLDAAAVVSFFSTMTIVVDATGQHTAILNVVAPVLSTIVSCKRRAAQACPVIGAAAAIAAAVLIAKRRAFM